MPYPWARFLLSTPSTLSTSSTEPPAYPFLRPRWYNAPSPEYPAFQGYPEYLAEDVLP